MLRAVKRRASDAVPLRLRQQFQYRRAVGRWLDSRSPTTWTEKLYWRIHHDRRPLLADAVNKLWMKDYAIETCGDLLLVPETIWSGVSLSEWARSAPPSERAWVAKPIAGMNARVWFGNGRPSIAEAVGVEAEWERRSRGDMRRGVPWGYQVAPRGFLVEEQVGTDPSAIRDYKVHVFQGRAALVQVIEGRWSGRQRQVLYDPDWTLVAHKGFSESPPAPCGPPPGVAALITAAERLGQRFDYIRVDLYLIGGEVWFGELTPYPNFRRFMGFPRLDESLGGLWNLPW